MLGFEVCSLEKTIELYRGNIVSKILICSVIHKSEISNELKNKGIDYNDIVCVDDIIGDVIDE